MTAKRKVVKRRIKVVRKSSSSPKYTPPKLPEKPPVTKGPKHYGRTKRGQYIIPRFIISEYRGKFKTKKTTRWWVLDMEEANIAEGTDKKGYSNKKEAINIAKEYRDEYGKWATIPF